MLNIRRSRSSFQIFCSRSFSRLEVPTKGNQKTKKIAVLLGVALFEWIITGGIFWAPLASAVTMIALTPGYHQSSQEEEDLIRRIEQQVRDEFRAKVPQTPPESAEWLNRMISVVWKSYFEPLILSNFVPKLQDRIIEATPKGWVLALENISLGRQAPIVSNVRVFNDVGTGSLSSIDADLDWNSNSCSIELSGNGPAGQFVVYVYGATLKGRIRLKPAPNDRMILFSFLDSPDASIKMSAKGPLIGTQDIPRFGFIKQLLLRLLEDALVEPRQGCLGLDYDFVQDKAIDTYLTVKVLSGNGLVPNKKKVSEGETTEQRILSISPQKSQKDGKKKAEEKLFRAQICSQNLGTKRSLWCSSVQGGSMAEWNKEAKVQLGDVEGRLTIDVFEEPKSQFIGSAKLDVAFMGDGSTGYWASSRSGRPITTRRGTEQGPWQIKLPLEGSKFGEINVAVSVSPWTMLSAQKGGQATTLSSLPHTVGTRTVFLQVLEARDLKAMDFGNKSDPYVVVKYNSRTFRSEVVFNSLEPIWNQSFCFEENDVSALGRKVRVEIWDYDRASADDFLGMVVLNLDLASDGQVVDRWWQLYGQDQGEVRIRMVITHGVPLNQKVQSAIQNIKQKVPAFGTPAIEVQLLNARHLGTSLRPVTKQEEKDEKEDEQDEERDEIFHQQEIEKKIKQKSSIKYNAKGEIEIEVSQGDSKLETSKELQDVSPQCVVKYGREEQHSPVHQNTGAPTWNYTLWFRHDKTKPHINFDLRDRKGLFGGGLGYAVVDIKQLLPSSTSTWEGWIPLSNSRSGKGEIYVKFIHRKQVEQEVESFLMLSSFPSSSNGRTLGNMDSTLFEEVEQKTPDLFSSARDTLSRLVNLID